MRLRFLMIVTAGLLLTATGYGEDPARNDQAQLQGTWSIVPLEVNGQAADVSGLKEARLLDMTITEGPQKGKT